MTESQTEYDTDAEPTKGRWIMATSNSYRRIVTEDMEPVLVPVTQKSDGHPDLHFPNGGYDGPDAHLMLAAGTAADEIAEMGYDPQKALEALPELLRAAKYLVGDSTVSGQACWGDTPPTAYLSAKPSLVEKVSSALAWAEGSKQ